jgi:hypothetical protein
MSNAEPDESVDEEKWERAKRRARRFFGRVGGWIAFGVALCVFLVPTLVRFHILPTEFSLLRSEELMLLIVTALGLVTLEYITEARKGIIAQFKRNVRDVAETVSPKVYRLVDCIRDLRLRLAELNPEARLTIRHIGLDMHVAWQYVRDEILTKCPRGGETAYELLVVSSDDGAELKKVLGGLSETVTNQVTEPGAHLANPTCAHYEPASVSAMRQSVARNLGTIKTDLEVGRHLYPGLRLTIRMYRDIPVIHGFTTDQPEKTYYVCFCRWRGENYEWGDKYYKIGEAPEGSSARDLREIFDNYFTHLWGQACEEVYTFPPKTQQKSS